MLKRVASLNAERVGSRSKDLHYIGLESVESGTGRLLKNRESGPSSHDANDEGIVDNLFVPGDVLFSKLRPYLAKAFLATERGVSTTELLVLKPNRQVNGRFLVYLMISSGFICLVDSSTYGAKMPRADWDFIGNVQVPIPSLTEQLAIADYLDRETAQIDTLVAEKEQWLSLLAEKRRALVTRAVTRGLNQDAPRKDSGFPWIGEVPEHWEVERSRWLFSERDVRSETGNEEMLTVSHITGVTPRSEKNVNMFEAETTVGYKTCSRGDLVINTMWAWMGAMGVAPVNGMVSPAYNVYTPVGRLAPEYIDALVRMPVFAEEVTRFSKGVWSSRLRLYPEDFFQVWLPLPPLAEQSAIVRHIETETGKLDALRDAAAASIALLRERRAALIAAAVTGKITLPNRDGDT